MMKQNLRSGEDWLVGEDIPRALQGLGMVVDMILKHPKRNSLISKLQQLKTICKKWQYLLSFPVLKEKTAMWEMITRWTCIPNNEEGCERTNSKYNLSKNKLSATMKLPMILARNRAGANGPPIHLFEPIPVLKYWKKNHHRLALKAKKSVPSRVLARIQREEEKTYTSKIYLS